MRRDDNSKFLLYIEPKVSEKLKEPINDSLTKIMEYALSKSKYGVGNYNMPEGEIESFHENSCYKGFHRTACGETSDNQDYLLENGMITNSLCVFYLQWYRNSIPKTDMAKLDKLQKHYYVAKVASKIIKDEKIKAS